jgi:hypothetical protein
VFGFPVVVFIFILNLSQTIHLGNSSVGVREYFIHLQKFVGVETFHLNVIEFL